MGFVQARLTELRGPALPHLRHRWSAWRASSLGDPAAGLRGVDVEMRECACGAVQVKPSGALLEELQLDSPEELASLERELQELSARAPARTAA